MINATPKGSHYIQDLAGAKAIGVGTHSGFIQFPK